MTDIINIGDLQKARRIYRRRVHDAAHAIRAFQVELHDLAAAIAFSGPLRAALAEKGVGAVVHVDEDMLLGTGDMRVVALVKVSRAIDEAVTAMYGEPMAK